MRLVKCPPPAGAENHVLSIRDIVSRLNRKKNIKLGHVKKEKNKTWKIAK